MNPNESDSKKRLLKPFLILVVAIVLIFLYFGNLESVFHPRRTEQAKLVATESNIRQVSDFVKLFHLDHGIYPRKLEDLVTKPGYIEAKAWPQGGYLKIIPWDGWGRAYVYRVYQAPGSKLKTFELRSLGSDPDDPADDISNVIEPR